MRKYVYDGALKDGLTVEKAIVLSNIFKNAYFMGCKYHDEVMEQSRKYWPEDALKKPLYEDD
jgi:hypothetical protein